MKIKDEDVICLQDSGGTSMEIVGYNGYFMSRASMESGSIPDIRTNIPNIIKMKVRPDDIFLVAYPKAGK